MKPTRIIRRRTAAVCGFAAGIAIAGCSDATSTKPLVVPTFVVVGDTAGSTIDGDGQVTTPPGFRAAYKQYVDAGWGAVPFPAEFGGGGFPWLVTVVMQ